MTEPVNEFSHILSLDQIRSQQSLELVANEGERSALAERFALPALEKLSARLTITHDSNVIHARGNMLASVTQSCIASGEPVEAEISEEIQLDFMPEDEAGADTDAEVELAEEECDIIFHDGQSIDFGEVVAQSLALALDPYPRSAKAAAALKKAGVKSEEEEKAESGPFAALAALKDKS